MRSPRVLLALAVVLAGALVPLSSCVTDRARPPSPTDGATVDGGSGRGPGRDDAANGNAAPGRGDGAAPRHVFDKEKTMRVHLLDVGQGAATLVELPCGAMLVDTGGEQNDTFDAVPLLQKQLERFFERRTDLRRTIDLLVITHPHIDHVRGLPMVLREFVVKNVVDDGRDGDDLVKEQIRGLRTAIEARAMGYRGVNNADISKKGGVTDDVIDPFRCASVDPVVRVLSGGVEEDPGWGTDNYGKAHFVNENNHSVVVRVDLGNASLLITGDLEEHAIEGLLERYRGTRWLDVDVYQVGHHGSANGTTRALVNAMSPDVALIAMGSSSRRLPWTAWTYGHPRQVVLDRLEQGVRHSRPHATVDVASGPKKFAPHGLDRAIYGTGWDGAVVVEMDIDGTIEVHEPDEEPHDGAAPTAALRGDPPHDRSAGPAQAHAHGAQFAQGSNERNAP